MIWLSTQIICVVIMLNPFTICALSTNFSAPRLCVRSVGGAGFVMYCAKCDAKWCALAGKCMQ